MSIEVTEFSPPLERGGGGEITRTANGRRVRFVKRKVTEEYVNYVVRVAGTFNQHFIQVQIPFFAKKFNISLAISSVFVSTAKCPASSK